MEGYTRHLYSFFKTQNSRMIGIDRQDRMLACFPVMRKCMKGYRKVFFYRFDIALFNSYILFNKINTHKKQTYAEYRIEIAQSLLKKCTITRIYTKRTIIEWRFTKETAWKTLGSFSQAYRSNTIEIKATKSL